MKRGLWIGVGLLVAVAVAIPVWMTHDDAGGARSAALVEHSLNCDGARDSDACARLETLLAEIDEDLAVAQGRLSAVQENYNAILTDEALLNSLGDDAQLANVDLQNLLQKQQQTLQMMSNISKTLHDTAEAIIRKVSG